MGICHSYTPDGRCVSLLKVLLTNTCIYDCAYCINRRSSDVERASFEPEELVQLTMDFYRRNYIEGLFLSSGVVKNPDETMGRMLKVVRTLRERERFSGYIHVKAVAGASAQLVSDAGRVADRVSVNVELPTEADLGRLAPEKRSEQIEHLMSNLREGIDAGKERTHSGRRQLFSPAGQSTQMIIGATPSSDRAVLDRAAGLYRTYALRRVYYSAFSPIPFADPNLPAKSPPLVREHRLYQADWLLRHYGFSVEEVTPDSQPNLELDIDPKLAWALLNREYFPVDLTNAPREQLLRVPGLGVRNVDRILELRRHAPITLDALRRLRVSMRLAQPFVITADRNVVPSKWLEHKYLRQLVAPPKQLALFGPTTE
jgi:putative DNA modification/repair radical SAM protein